MGQFYIFVIFTTLYMVVQGANIATLSFENAREEDPICKKPGPACSDCNTAVICVDTGNGWDIIEVDQCGAGLSCLNGECTDKTNPPCGIGGNVQFLCTAVGMFPDPYNCQTYHACCAVGSKSSGQSCGEKYMYDPASTYCKTAMPSTGCPSTSLVPTCKNPGDSGAIPKNKSIYYICTYVTSSEGKRVLYPVMHLCPNGKIYSNGQCS